MRLTEFHSGFRAYSTAALAELPFDYNTDDFHFDTDIIIQVHRHGGRIVEIPIPTYYGDEICHVNGMAYAWNVTRSTLGSRLQQLGILSRRKYEAPSGENVYLLKEGYPSSHTFALDAVEPGSKVLDLGCGIGLFADRLAAKGCRVTGVDMPPATDEEMAGRLDRFLRADLEDPALMDQLDDDYDTVVMLDVIEHLRDPSGFLDRLRHTLGRRRPRVILTTPNIGFFLVRLSLLFGQFNYGERGILDRTHTKLFTFRTLRQMLEESGYVVRRMRGVPAPFPLALGDGFLSRLMVRANGWAIRLLRGLFSYQIYVEAEIVPTVGTLLDVTMITSRKAAEAWTARRVQPDGSPLPATPGEPAEV
jgi:2-polyprenyl-3-methyl-5-hydroxy-6-metoxy-1,4-benzoquinol methylase